METFPEVFKDVQRYLLREGSLFEAVTSRFGKPPTFRVVSQAWSLSPGPSSTLERVSSYTVDGNLVSLHLVHLEPALWPQRELAAFLGGARLGGLMEQYQWRRHGVRLFVSPSPWRGRALRQGWQLFEPWAPLLVRRFWVGGPGRAMATVWELLPLEVWVAGGDGAHERTSGR